MTSHNVPASALSRRQLVGLGLGLAALAALSAAPARVRAAEPASASGSMGSTTVCGVPFSLPQGWRVEDSQSEAERVVIFLFDPFTQREVGLAVLAGEEASDGEDGISLGADELFARLVEDSVPADGAAWGLERHDIEGFVPAATCSYAALREGGLMAGRLYLAKVPSGGHVILAVLAEPSEVDAALAQADAMWQGAGWGDPAVARLDEFKRAMLEDGIASNAENPHYNPYWQVTDFTCTLNTVNPEAPYPSRMRYQYTTPEGFEAWEDELVAVTALGLYGASTPIWAMYRVDSDGAPYLRSTVSIAGDTGVVDIAFYEGFSDCWYIAATGEAVAPDAGGYWHRFGADEAPWTPHALKGE